MSEIERYERVRIAALPPHAHIAGFAADDLSHLLAELMENATAFSPPDMPVEVSGWLLENGEVMLSVQDEGIGMAEDRLERLNTRLTEFDPDAAYDAEAESDDDGLGLGLYVVARLAHRHGVRVQLRKQKQGGIAAVVVLPDPLLAPATPTAVPSSVPGGTHTVTLPGADAEANSNVLRGRTKSGDLLVDLAERTIEAQETAGTSKTPSPEAPAAQDETRDAASASGSAHAANRTDAAAPADPATGTEATSGNAARVAPEASDTVPAAHTPAASGPALPAEGTDAATPAAPAADTTAVYGSAPATGPAEAHGAEAGPHPHPGAGDEPRTHDVPGPLQRAGRRSHPPRGAARRA